MDASAEPAPLEPPSEQKRAAAPRGVADELAGLGHASLRIIALELARAQVALERSGLAVARALTLAAGALALGAALLLSLVFGLIGGLSALTAWPLWLAALVIGLSGPLLAALSVCVALARRERRRLATISRTSTEARTEP